MSATGFCCDGFADAATPPTSSGVIAPHRLAEPNEALLEKGKNPGEWNARRAFTGIRYCPFCGMLLTHRPFRRASDGGWDV